MDKIKAARKICFFLFTHIQYMIRHNGRLAVVSHNALTPNGICKSGDDDKRRDSSRQAPRRTLGDCLALDDEASGYAAIAVGHKDGFVTRI